MKCPYILGQKGNQPKGFTLLEVLVAIVILSVGLLGMACLAGAIIGYNQYASEVTGATTLAQDKMEEFKNKDFESISDSTCSATEETIDIDNVTYTRCWKVHTDTPDDDMTSIEVKVVWNFKGAAKDVALKTIIAK